MKICDSSIVRPLLIIYKNCLQSRSFPDNWKKSSVVLIHKKSDKQLLQNYWPISLLSICIKTFEIIIFNPIFEFLDEMLFFFQINLDFIHFTHLKISCCHWFMISMLILINIQLLKWELAFYIFQKPLTECRMKVY